MNYPTFPTPSAAVVDLMNKGQRFKAAKEWQKEARATLDDGALVAPSISLAASVIRGLSRGIPALPIAVEGGNYVDAKDVEESVAAQKLKAERFARYMEEDQLAEFSNGVCDSCGATGTLKNFYAPDGMGYPTLVLQQCAGGC